MLVEKYLLPIHRWNSDITLLYKKILKTGSRNIIVMLTGFVTVIDSIMNIWRWWFMYSFSAHNVEQTLMFLRMLSLPKSPSRIWNYGRTQWMVTCELFPTDDTSSKERLQLIRERWMEMRTDSSFPPWLYMKQFGITNQKLEIFPWYFLKLAY